MILLISIVCLIVYYFLGLLTLKLFVNFIGSKAPDLMIAAFVIILWPVFAIVMLMVAVAKLIVPSSLYDE
jgi:hypothetical protein